MPVKRQMLQNEAMSKKERTPQANIAPFGLRMQPDLKARIEESARKNERSMNAEIVARLEQAPELETLQREIGKRDYLISQLQEVDEMKDRLIHLQEENHKSLHAAFYYAGEYIKDLVDAVLKAADGDTEKLQEMQQRLKENPADFRRLLPSSAEWPEPKLRTAAAARRSGKAQTESEE